MSRFLNSFLIFVLFNSFVFAQDAVYSLDFISNWTSSQHPTDYPTAAHWSTLVGTTHNNSVSFWGFGQFASPGVKDVAELGVRTNIVSEINTSITNGNAYQLLEFPLGLGTLFSFEGINIDANFPYISLMSMVAPSPDWLAEIHNVKLTDGSGNWLPTLTVNVYATDAGTDSGATYMSADLATIPPQPISSLQNVLPFSDKIVVTFSFVLDQILSVGDAELQNSISIYPNPSKGEIFINNSGNSILENAEIFDVTGKKLKKYYNLSNEKNIRFNTLESGLSFLKVNSNKGSTVKKLIIK